MSVVDVQMTHMDYPVTNVQWKRIDNIVLWDYLRGLHLIDLNNSLMIFQGTLDVFYFRYRHNDDRVTKIDYNCDPWNRRFVVYRPMLQFYTNTNDVVYEYYSYITYKSKIDVDVIVTTVNKDKVYCVDVIKNV